MYPVLQYHAVFKVVEEHPASNESEWKLEERLVVVCRWDPQSMRKGWTEQILQLDPLANPRTWSHL